MSRSLPEWIGKDDDAVPPLRVRLRVFEAYGGKCWLTGRKIMPGDEWDIDHKVALVNGGRNVESNLAPALRYAHRIKTASDVGQKAAAAKAKAKHFGMKAKRRRIVSRGFEPAPPQRTASRPLLRKSERNEGRNV